MTTATARHTDPATSHAAGESMAPHVPHDQALVLTAIHLAGDRGATAHDVRTHMREVLDLDRDQNCVSKRMSELKDAGLIRETGEERPGRTGRMCTVCVCTVHGERVATS